MSRRKVASVVRDDNYLPANSAAISRSETTPPAGSESLGELGDILSRGDNANGEIGPSLGTETTPSSSSVDSWSVGRDIAAGKLGPSFRSKQRRQSRNFSFAQQAGTRVRAQFDRGCRMLTGGRLLLEVTSEAGSGILYRLEDSAQG